MTDIPIPERLARRPRDHRGFVVPFFVAWLRDGKPVNDGYGEPDFRVVDPARMVACVKNQRCWLCGDKLGTRLAFVLGPMCTINKIISEPPSHRECAEYAMKACPFLSRPAMKRNEKSPYDAPVVPAAGMHSGNNPGVMALWITRSYQVVQAHAGHPGVLFRIGPCEYIDWWREGRAATRQEVNDALRAGYATLMEQASKQPGGVDELDRLMPAALATVPT